MVEGEDDRNISAFAYNTGRIIEDLITERTKNLEYTNQQLEAKILQWYTNNRADKGFAKHFGITNLKGEEYGKD
jgi:hypothetical protein